MHRDSSAGKVVWRDFCLMPAGTFTGMVSGCCSLPHRLGGSLGRVRPSLENPGNTKKYKRCTEIPLRVRWFGGSLAACPRKLFCSSKRLKLFREALGRPPGAFCGGFWRILVNLGSILKPQKVKKCTEIPLWVRCFGGSVASCLRGTCTGSSFSHLSKEVASRSSESPNWASGGLGRSPLDNNIII